MPAHRPSATLRLLAGSTALLNSRDFSDHMVSTFKQLQRNNIAIGFNDIERGIRVWLKKHPAKSFTRSFDRRSCNKSAAKRKTMAKERIERLFKCVRKPLNLIKANRRQVHLDAGKLFGTLLGKNYISRLERAVTRERWPGWVKKTSKSNKMCAEGDTLRSLFGPGAISGTNCANNRPFSLFTNATSLADMLQGWDDSWKHNRWLRDKLLERGRALRLLSTAAPEAHKNGTGLQFIWCELSKISKILCSLNELYLRGAADRSHSQLDEMDII